MKKIIGFILIPFMISYFLRFLYVLSLLFQNFRIFQALVYGFIVFAMLYILIFQRHLSFWLTFEHELTHIIFAILMFKPVSALHVSKYHGGATVLEQRANFIIRLAPYFFPTFPMVILLFKPVIHPGFSQWYLFVLGFFLGYHVLSSIRESHWYQPDLQTDGLFFSYIFIILMHTIFLSMIILVILDNWRVVLLFLKDGFMQPIYFFREILNLLGDGSR